MFKIKIYDWLDILFTEMGDMCLNLDARFKYYKQPKRKKTISIRIGLRCYRISMKFGYKAFQLREEKGLNP